MGGKRRQYRGVVVPQNLFLARTKKQVFDNNVLVGEMAKVAKQDLQTAYAGMQKSLQQDWHFLHV